MTGCPVCGASNPPGARFCNACGTRLGGAEQGAATGERRVVTMLFCDVRGSTSMAENLDPEEWTDVMNAAFEHLIAPVYHYEGTVARLMGDAILAFFGAPTAHEDDPQRAVMAGLEIVASTRPFRERLAAERGFDLDVRVGINTGPVVVGDVGSELRQEYSAMGDAVNVAARMEQTADPGTVRIAEDTYRLVADLFDVEPLGEVELKGKRQPVRSYRVLRRRAGAWKTRATRSLRAPLVGRDHEMAVVRSAIDEARRAGQGRVVLLVGEPGIGKSRIVEEANAIWSARHPGDDRRWDLWQCVPFDAMQPYAQYRRIFRERAGILDADPPDAVRTKIDSFLSTAPERWRERNGRVARALLGVERDDETRLEGEEFKREATEVLVGSSRARTGPRFIVFEDLHWCDHASLELARETTHIVEDLPCVLLVTFRPDREAPSWAFKEWVETALPERTTLLEFEPLTQEQSGELVDSLLPVADFPDVVRRRILDKTEGNPLFVEEVARSLLDRGAIADGSWALADVAAEFAIPDSVQSLITVGLDRLPEGARRTLQTAAVIGRTFDVDVLGAVADADGELPGHLRELERQDLIRATADAPRREYTFRHALTHEAAYGSLLLKNRRAVHRRVAEALEAANPERVDEVAPLLAHHFAEARDDDATLRYAEIAADAAARLYANDDAERHYRVAIDAAKRSGAGTPLLTSLFGRRGGALELAGRYDDAIENYEEMREIGRSAGDEAMVLAANGSFALLYSTVTPKFDPERGLRMSEENVATARRLGDRVAEARSLWNILVASIYGRDDPARAVEAGEESLAIARELDVREQIAFTLNDLSRAYLSVDDFASAAARLAEARRLFEELGNRVMLCENVSLASSTLMLQGHLDLALAQADAALAIAEEIGNDWGRSFSRIVRYRALLDRGDLGPAIGEMERSMEAGERGGFGYAAIGPPSELAMVLAYLGHAEGGLELANRALEISRERLPGATVIPEIARAHVLLALGRRADAAAAIGKEAEFTVEPDRTIVTAAGSLVRSRLALASGDVAEAERRATWLLDYLHARGVEVFVAEALLQLARAQLAAGAREAAGRTLREARERAERLGERRALWEILAMMAGLRDSDGETDAASELRRSALAIVEEIAAGVGPELRSSFLSRADVVALRATTPVS
jgi:class 3 adenylate cyclase/tetratricopeptide (TPR) repeat protein